MNWYSESLEKKIKLLGPTMDCSPQIEKVPNAVTCLPMERHLMFNSKIIYWLPLYASVYQSVNDWTWTVKGTRWSFLITSSSVEKIFTSKSQVGSYYKKKSSDYPVKAGKKWAQHQITHNCSFIPNRELNSTEPSGVSVIINLYKCNLIFKVYLQFECRDIFPPVMSLLNLWTSTQLVQQAAGLIVL